MPLRILSWNIQHGGGKRVAAISRALTSRNPDCAVLVEFCASPASRTIAAHLANLGLTHQLDTARAHDPRRTGTRSDPEQCMVGTPRLGSEGLK